MSSIKSEYKPRNLKVYCLDDLERLLKGVKVAACMLTESPQLVVDEQSVLQRVNALTISGPRSERSEQCSCCGVPFQSRAQQIAHYKHHWHAYNIKRRLFGKTPLTLANFTNRNDDNSSVSGSDSEDDTGGTNGNNIASDLFAAATRHCKAFFSNSSGEVFCLYRCILHHRKETLSTDGEGWAWTDRCKELVKPGRQRWAVFMVSGGHFAGAIFSGGAPVLHKTLHSYTVRRGQGQAQGTRDQQGNAPKSAGASIRRYNQAQFALHVQEILTGWKEDLAGCSLILYRAVGPLNNAVLFGKASPLVKDDIRLRAFPFPTRKPTFKEVQRAHATVANIEVYDSLELFQKALIASTPPTSKSDSDRSRKTKSSPNKPVDRAKSREPIARELPTQIVSSEDEGPCYIDSETPADWIKTLSEQSNNGVITNSRKDLLRADSVEAPVNSESETDEEGEGEKKTGVQQQQKKKKKKKPKVEDVKKPQRKIPDKIKNMWKVISSGQAERFGTVVETWEIEELTQAVNTADPRDGNTALHKAAIASSPLMVTRILTAGGDPCARNHAMQTPYVAGDNKDTRLAFRLFQGEFPDKFNYAKAHIPGPLTPELLSAENEKKAAQRRAKRQREKDRQIERANTDKFLELTDCEKSKKLEPRCFLCGTKLPRVCFEYEQYKFCSVRCLQNHRNVRPLHLPA